ncbi:MAG: Coproheme decarboxylase HemQ (no EC), partial [uncultured Rubrobacteraceae bacterium]
DRNKHTPAGNPGGEAPGPVRQLHLLQARPAVAPSPGEGAGGGPQRVPRGRRGARRRDAPAVVLADGPEGRRGLHAVEDRLRPRRVRGPAGGPDAERARQVPHGRLLVLRPVPPLHLRRRAHAGVGEPPLHRAGRGRVHLRLPVRKDPAVVPSLPGRAPADDERAHARRPQALPGKEQHRLLLRHRRLRVHPLLRGRVPGEVPGPHDGAA